ncbi:hypothetical protein HUA78_21365 [Myxococcus sp. CA033]|uniref:hypothetical protein n=1 Tax=Myxococcus sp. CA033 TaxID=2741516 RepID=UPI00157B00E6|nr:hypothetical protein [Myxococcus sp. CA033]NTX37001.1 hypothetical protein [Myxococcus sp. CA033]
MSRAETIIDKRSRQTTPAAPCELFDVLLEFAISRGISARANSQTLARGDAFVSESSLD